jgi:hypothetical protein
MMVLLRKINIERGITGLLCQLRDESRVLDVLVEAKDKNEATKRKSEVVDVVENAWPPIGSALGAKMPPPFRRIPSISHAHA